MTVGPTVDAEFLPSATEHRLKDSTSAARALAEAAADALRHALRVRGTASLLVPGGRSASAVLPFLFDASLPWRHVRVSLTDERWVPVDSADSNEGLVRRLMANRAAAEAKLIGYRDAGSTLDGSVAAVSDRLATLSRPFDVVFVGMGEDGHVASVFPGDRESGAPTVRVGSAPFPPYERLTLTINALAECHASLLYIPDAVKEQAYRRGMLWPGQYPVGQLLTRNIGRTVVYMVAAKSEEEFA